MRSEIESLSTISCLINNAAILYPYPDAFFSGPKLTLDFCQEILTINAVALTKLTRIVLPKMVEDALPVRGVNRFIINMSSICGTFTTPYFSVYSATKAYVNHFTRGLAYELKNTCVRVQAFAPYCVATKMSGITEPSCFIPSPLTYAESALSMLGVETLGCGYLPHALLIRLCSLIPSDLLTSFFAKQIWRVRKEYLSKHGAV